MPGTTRRPNPIVAVGPYLVLVAVAIFAVLDARDSGDALAVNLALLAGMAVWMLGVFTLHPAWHDRPTLMVVFVVVLFAFATVLVVREPWFGVLAIAGYIYSFAVVAWPWRLYSVGAFAVLAATAQSSSVPKDTVNGLVTFGAVIAINVIALCVFTWIHWSSSVVSEQRRLALEENTRLHEQLVEQAREAGVLNERQRLAREIHDTLAQGLVGIITQLQAADQAGRDSSEQRRHLEAAAGLARESLNEARLSVQALQPALLDSTSISDAVRQVAARWSERQDIPVRTTIVGDPLSLRPVAETALLRAEQEALSNIERHAVARQVGVTLSYLPGQVILDVRDDGIGFDPSALDEPLGDVSEGGFGLRGMRQRVQEIGGTLLVESEPERGTVISVAVPLEGAPG